MRRPSPAPGRPPHPGQAADDAQFAPPLAAIRVTRRRGRPGIRPVHVLADMGYSYSGQRGQFRRKLAHIIPEGAVICLKQFH